MPEPTPGGSDRNLLFGVLALQMDFIDRDALVRGMNAWALDKAKPLGQVLQEQGALDEDLCAFLEALVDKHLARHGGDARHSLAFVSSLGPVRDDLRHIDDAELQASLAHASVARPPQPDSDAPPAVEGTSTAAGLRFRILRPHAEGGLGRVSVARDEKLHRQVALKEIRPDRRGDPYLRRRFLAEAEITGQLEHPGVVPVYALEEGPDGEPYYAMRFVQGRTLADAIRAYHAAPAPLAFRDLLKRYTDACQTLAYAHSKGVVHRDLKPANVMVGDYGETLVVDWGLAKRLGAAPAAGAVQPAGEGAAGTMTSDEAQTTDQRPAESAGGGLTQAGQVLGTPAYMAPEQAEGRVEELGPAADVYALGAILYEILTGQAPYRGAGAAVLAQVRQGPPPGPGQVRRGVPPALAAVCQKAMARSAADRYAGAAELAREVERWLADEPVSAYREPLLARAARWGRHHKATVAGAITLLVTAVLALTASTFLISREQGRTEAARGRAQDNFVKARSAVDLMLTQVSEDEDQLFDLPRVAEVRRRLLEEALAFYQGLSQEDSQDPEVRAETARAYLRVGGINDELGRHAEAEGAYRAALSRLGQLAAEHPDVPDYRKELARSHHNLGVLLNATGRAKQAEEAYRAALDLAERLVHEHPAAPDFRYGLALSHASLGLVLQATDQPQAAEASCRAALAHWERLAQEHPATPAYRRGLAHSHASLGALLGATGRPQAAEGAYRAALSHWERLAREQPAVPAYRKGLAASHTSLGALLQATGRPREAESSYRAARDLQERLAHDHPAVPGYRHDLAKTHASLSLVLQATGRPQAAEESCRAARDHWKRLAQEHPAAINFQQGLAGSHYNLGFVLQATGRPKEAEASYRAALALRQRLAHDHPAVPDYRKELALSHTSLGVLLQATGRPREAEASYRAARDLQERLAREHPAVPAYRDNLANSHFYLGLLLQATGRPKEAEASYRAALDLRQRLAHDHPAVPDYRKELALSHNRLGGLLQATGRPREAEASYRAALALQERLAREHPAVPGYRSSLADSHTSLGVLLRVTGRPQAAEESCRAALALCERLAQEHSAVPDNRNALAGAMVNLAQLLRDRQDLGGARRVLEQAQDHHQAALRANPNNPTYRLFYRNNRWVLADTLVGLGDHAAAAEAAAQWAQAAVDPAGDEYNAACFLARCVPLAEKDATLPEARRQELAHSYADRAVDTLRQAVKNGFKDAAHLKKDPDLDPLRQRADFQQLLQDLEKSH
jgi:serine/threonine-protein kinase